MTLTFTHHGDRVVHCVETTDALRPMRSRTRDELLDSPPPEKIVALGTTWTGELKPHIDAVVEAIQPLVKGFIINSDGSPHIVDTEGPGTVVDLGRKWAGKLLAKIDGANVAGDADEHDPENADLTEVRDAAARLRRACASRDIFAAHDATCDLEAAAKKVIVPAAATPSGWKEHGPALGRVTDSYSGGHPMIFNRRASPAPVLKFGCAPTPAEINRRNREHAAQLAGTIPGSQDFAPVPKVEIPRQPAPAGTMTTDRSHVTPGHFGRRVSPKDINELNRQAAEEERRRILALAGGG